MYICMYVYYALILKSMTLFGRSLSNMILEIFNCFSSTS